MSFERDVHAMLADFTAVHGRVHKLIWVRELAAFHKLEKMLRVRMPEQQAIWKRENDFDRNEIVAKRHERIPVRRLYAGYDPDFFCTGQPLTLEEFTMGFNVEVERLR